MLAMTKMKVVGFCVFFLVIESAFFMQPSCSSTNDMTLPATENSRTTTSIGELKVEGGSYSRSTKKRKMYAADNVYLEDYGQIDPAPSSTSTITSGPIEHGTPLIPYIPNPTPPPSPPLPA